MHDANEVVDAAVAAAAALPAAPTFQAWCRAYRAGRHEEEGAKRAFRSVWWSLANGRVDDFARLLTHAEGRVSALKMHELVSWTQAAAARAVLELMRSRALASGDAAEERRTRAGVIAAAALRFAEAARRLGGHEVTAADRLQERLTPTLLR